MKHSIMSLGVLVVVLVGSTAVAADWPQFGGLNRDGKSAETGLLKSWPDGGPKKLWTSPVDLGDGFSSVTVAGDSIFVTGVFEEAKAGADGQSAKVKVGYLIALDLAGKLKWKVPYGPEWTRNFPHARTSPTVDGDRVYTMSGIGRIACFDARTGREHWACDTAETCGSQRINWGLAESVLIYKNLAICTPGGTKAAVVAFDKTTGKEAWATADLTDKAAYCSPILIADGARRLMVTMTSDHIVGIDPDDGTVLWKHPYRGRCQAHANSPIYHQGRIFVTSGYNDGAVALDLADDGRSVKLAWTNKEFDTHHGGVVLVDGHLYGANWINNGRGNWMCVDWKTGKATYETEWKCKGSIAFADGMLYCYEEKTGHIALVAADPSGFTPVSSFEVTEGTGRHWAHPVIANGRLYIRHGKALMAYDIKAR